MASGSWNPPSLPPRQPQATPMTTTLPPRLRVQSVSEHYRPTTTPISFPEPQFRRATSHRESLSVPSHRLTHYHSRSDLAANSNLSNLSQSHTNPSVVSFASSYAEDDHYGLGSNQVGFRHHVYFSSPNLSVGIRR